MDTRNSLDKDVSSSCSNHGCVHVVIPVHNRCDLTVAMLRTMVAQTCSDLSITVVDDGSTDGTSEAIRDEFPDVRLIVENGNQWWTGSINRGIEAVLEGGFSEDDFVLVINDDLEVGEDYVEVLLKASESNGGAIVGSVNVDIKDPAVIVQGGARVNWWYAKHKPVNNGRRLDEFAKGTVVEVDYLSGRGVLFPIRVFQDVGLYDENWFQQCGDLELPVRASRRGYRLVMSYDAVVMSHCADLKRLSFSDLRWFLFDTRSNHRLKTRLGFAWLTRKNLLQFISFLTFDFLRIIGGFGKRLGRGRSQFE